MKTGRQAEEGDRQGNEERNRVERGRGTQRETETEIRETSRQQERGGQREERAERQPSPRGLTKVKGVLRSVIIMSATARLTMKRLVAECIRWFLKMT